MAKERSFMLALWHFHIEISSKCTLACPRCARQEVPDTLVNTELDLEFFKRNFTVGFIKKNVEKITFCGDDGDPIYAHDLIPVIKYIKDVKPTVEIVIITNGSHKKLSWWVQLGKILDTKDSVHFSIDGYDNISNNKYRVNSDYDSIIAGLQTLRTTSRCQIVWAAIAFQFNENQITSMQNFAKQLGVDRFQLTRSTKFAQVYPIYGPDDQLQPSPHFISKTQRFEREVIDFTFRQNPTAKINYELYESVKENKLITPLCSIGNKGLYISAQGLLYPCCWVANRYSHNNEWQEIAKRFNLHESSLQDCIEDSFWRDTFQSYKWHECQTKCAANVVDEKYATEW
jgi:MoaA/NifB/PqqE/SkfB family radical SAM enzyme